jgi:tetratricopeptide (TPR) repeat protein
MRPPGDDETWDEDFPDHRAMEPLEIRLSIQPARPRSNTAHREAAQRLLAELLELPGEERHRRLREGPFDDPYLFDLLLERGHTALPFDLNRAVDLMGLATLLGIRLTRSGALMEDEGVSRALCLMGTAYRLRGDVAIADAAFEKAGRLAISAPERGFFGRTLALLRWDQGRSEEAVALLQQAGERFAEAGDAQEQAVCSALLGLLYVEEMRTAPATPCLRQASKDLFGGGRPWLAAQVQLGLAVCGAVDGKRERARSARKQALEFYGAVKDEMALLSLHWLEGRGALLNGDFEDAEELLTTVRGKLIERRCLPEATLVTIDLGVLGLLSGRREEVGAQVKEIAAAFEHSPGLDLATSALAQFLEQVETGQEGHEVWSSLVPTLRLAFRIQGVSAAADPVRLSGPQATCIFVLNRLLRACRKMSPSGCHAFEVMLHL